MFMFMCMFMCMCMLMCMFMFTFMFLFMYNALTPRAAAHSIGGFQQRHLV